MDRHLSVIESLAHGIDPGTGNELPHDSPYNNPEVIRALFFALSALKKMPERRSKLTIEQKQSDNIANAKPRNAGLPWTDEQRHLLAQHFTAGESIAQIAQHHERTETAILSELKKMNLIL